MDAADPRAADPRAADPRATETVGHLQAAATEMIAAARAFLDLLEDVVEDDETVAAAASVFGWFNRWNGLMGSELEAIPAEALAHVPWLASLQGQGVHTPGGQQ